jgi:hypothetical protein
MLCNASDSKGATAYSQGPSTELFGAGNGLLAATSDGGGRFLTYTNDRKPNLMITYTLINFSNIESMYVMCTLLDLKK